MSEKNTCADPSAFSPLVWEGPAIGLMDLDAFFASVEQLDHPEWRERPVIVGGSPKRRGVVSTASYEARKFGVHSAMPSFEAQRLCPDAIWTEGHFARYREVSTHVMNIIADETPLVEQVSIDEAFFDITPGRYSRESPIAICKRIQSRVSDLGITCSIGLGTNKTVAKIASERVKPRGLTVVMPQSEASFLAPLPIRTMSGIGEATAMKLESLGIRTLGQLARCDLTKMQHIFGVAGPRMVRRAAGLEHATVAALDAAEEVKSVSNERTFAHDLLERKELEAAIAHVSSLVGTRLRRKGLAGTQVTLKLKFDARHTHTAQAHLTSPTDDEHVFGRAARDLLGKLWREGTPVRLVGVAVSRFNQARPKQLNLFGNTETNDKAESQKLRELSVTTDAIRTKFGATALTYGRELRFKDNTNDTLPMGGERT